MKKLKRMPVSNSNASPLFIILLVFLLSGAVLGAFSGVYTPNLELSQAILESSNRSFVWCIIDALKYNLVLILFSRFCGFLIPFFVSFRGFCLFFTVTSIYKDVQTFLDKMLLFENILVNIVAIPCFIYIAVSSMKIFANKKRRSNNQYYAQIAFFLIINLLWSLICYFIF